MKSYRKKPIVIEAIQFTEESKDRVFRSITCNSAADRDDTGNPIIRIQTLEGIMTVKLGDWVIKGVVGEFYPCKPDVFDATYELVSAQEEV